MANTRGNHRRPGIEPARYNNVTTTLSDDDCARLLAWIEKTARTEAYKVRGSASDGAVGARDIREAMTGFLESWGRSQSNSASTHKRTVSPHQ